MASACPNCGSPVHPGAITCATCGYRFEPERSTGGSRFVGALNFAHTGRRYTLGASVDGYAIWDIALEGEPVRSFPRTDEGWREAWTTFQQLEASYVPPRQWRRGMPIQLQPLRIGLLLDSAINLYRLHFRTLMPLVAFVAVPFNFALTLVIRSQIPATLGAITQADVERIVGRIGIVTMIGAALYFLFVSPFVTGAVVRTAGDAYLGGEPSIRRAYGTAIRRLHSILWVSLLFALAGTAIVAPAVFLGVVSGSEPVLIVLVLGAVVPAIMVVVSFAFAAPIVVLEDVRGTAALGRSARLTKGLRWRIFGTMLLAALLAGVVQALFALPFELAADGDLTGAGWVVAAVGDSLADIIATPFITLVSVLLYFDARIRKEAFDLEVMAQQLGEPPAGTA